MNSTASTAMPWHPTADVQVHTPAMPGFAFRLIHQFTHEWRAHSREVLLWLAALAWVTWEQLQIAQAWGQVIPEFAPAIFALAMMVRSVARDRATNVEATSHTRPCGRGAVWSGKVLFFVAALLLPWLAAGSIGCMPLGFAADDWFAFIAGRLWLGLLFGSLTAVAASLWKSMPRNAFIVVLAGAALSLLIWATSSFNWMNDEKCAVVVMGCIVSASALIIWWSLALHRSPWEARIVGCACGVAMVWLSCRVRFDLWTHDWISRPVPAYTESKPAVHVGKRPKGPAQELWPRVFVTGLPLGRVASVISFRPLREPGEFTGLCSDYMTLWSEQKHEYQRWTDQPLTTSHAEALRSRYPDGALWHGGIHWERESLRTIVNRSPGSENKPWKLKLSVQSMRRVTSMPLRQTVSGSHSEVIHPGMRLRYHASDPDHKNLIVFKSYLNAVEPRLLPTTTNRALRTGVPVREPSFFAILSSPLTGEVSFATSGNENARSQTWLLEKVHHRQAPFEIPHPRAHMDIAGLTLDEWIDGCTFDLWVADEHGVIELDLTPEQMKQALTTD